MEELYKSIAMGTRSISDLTDDEFDKFSEAEFNSFMDKFEQEQSQQEETQSNNESSGAEALHQHDTSDVSQNKDVTGETPSATEADEGQSEQSINYQEKYESLMKNISEKAGFAINDDSEVSVLIEKAVNQPQVNIEDERLLETIRRQKLTEEQLNFLFDLNQKKPEAISKLLADSEVDAYSLPEASEYKTQNHFVQQNEVVLSNLVKSTNKDLLNDVQGYDQESLNAIYQNPNILSLLNEQKTNGLYDEIVQEMTRRRMFGKLGPGSFLSLYDAVGGEVIASKQNHQKPQTTTQQKPNFQKETPPDYATGAQAGGSIKPEFDPESFDVNSLTDEEFEKMGGYEGIMKSLISH